MRIAIPVKGPTFCEHFGRADGFSLCDVEPGTRLAVRSRQVVRPRYQCENVPEWLKAMRVTLVIAGGIGPVAQGHLAALGITVVPGQTGTDPLDVAQHYLNGRADPRVNPCRSDAHELRHCRRKNTVKGKV